MSVQLYQIIEVDCRIDHLDRSDVIGRMKPPFSTTAEHRSERSAYAEMIPSQKARRKAPKETDSADALQAEALGEHVDFIVDECLETLKPRGVYKLFNPAICTLPPGYTEPAIKLVGTMMVLKGKDVYGKMRRATHCVLMAAVIGSQTQLDDLREKLCYTELDAAIFDATCETLMERVGDMVNADIIRTALEKGLYTDERFSPGSGDFPLEMNSQIVFYVQSEKRLGLKLQENGTPTPMPSILAVVGMYDKSQKGRRRACGRCKYREFCSIRAIGMNCHGGKGTFTKTAQQQHRHTEGTASAPSLPFEAV